MNEYESAVAAARVASRENLLAKYRRDLAAALDERDEALVRLSFLKQSEDTTGRALANCLVALDDMTLERDQAEAALQECSVDERNWNRERDRLETELEHANNSLAVAQEDNIELSNELSQARNRIFSLEYSLSQVRKQRDGLIAWWQDANGYVEEAGM